MIVVAAIQRVEIVGASAPQVLGVGRDRATIAFDHVTIAAAQHVDVGRHVDQVPGIMHQITQCIGRAQCPLRGRRHLHQVDVEV
jgi:hypothetical protein